MRNSTKNQNFKKKKQKRRSRKKAFKRRKQFFEAVEETFKRRKQLRQSKSFRRRSTKTKGLKKWKMLSNAENNFRRI